MGKRETLIKILHTMYQRGPLPFKSLSGEIPSSFSDAAEQERLDEFLRALNTSEEGLGNRLMEVLGREILSSFRKPDGSKNSRRIIRTLLDLGIPDTKAQAIVSAWSRLFQTRSYEFRIGVELRDFLSLGSYECDNRSCWRADGANGLHPILLYYLLPSFTILLLSPSDGRVIGRCWGFFDPDDYRYAYLSNFYGVTSRKVYVRALESALGVPLVWGNSSVEIGVYVNPEPVYVRHASLPQEGRNAHYKVDVRCAICDERSDWWVHPKCIGCRICGSAEITDGIYCGECVDEYTCRGCSEMNRNNPTLNGVRLCIQCIRLTVAEMVARIDHTATDSVVHEIVDRLLAQADERADLYVDLAYVEDYLSALGEDENYYENYEEY